MSFKLKLSKRIKTGNPSYVFQTLFFWGEQHIMEKYRNRIVKEPRPHGVVIPLYKD